MSGEETPIKPRSHAGQAAPWIITVLLSVIATALWLRPPGALLSPAFAQGQSPAGARGIYAFTGQLDHNRYGLFMLDIDQGTIWCYEIDSSGPNRKLRLMAARSWIYDRYLQDFNCAEPGFRMVQELVAQQRAGAERPQNPPDDVDRDSKPQDTGGAGAPGE